MLAPCTHNSSNVNRQKTPTTQIYVVQSFVHRLEEI
uniref:Uncharacterized protein n=1 Tax=Arundo donax TaxID=35708 RepID=A0A0A8ZI85_ARUDO